jgi:hypothetical protein
MGTQCEGEYPVCKYEDKRVLQIKNYILYSGQRRKSYQVPWTYNDCTEMIKSYIQTRIAEKKADWGFKVPDITLCYEMWMNLLPAHKVIGVTRDLDGVQKHYARRHPAPDPGIIAYAWHMYNTMMKSYGIPIIRFEDILDHGPIVIGGALGLSCLPDVRRKK